MEKGIKKMAKDSVKNEKAKKKKFNKKGKDIVEKRLKKAGLPIPGKTPNCP